MKGSAYYQAQCGVRLADLYFKMKKNKEAKKLLNQVGFSISQGKKSDEPIFLFVGYSRYRLAEEIEKGARFSPLKFPESQLKKALEQRLHFFDLLVKSYLQAVDVGGPWAVASLNRMAKWAMVFADEVDLIRPAGAMKQQELEKFKNTLSSISTPLRKKAFESWEKAYQIAVQHEIFSPVLPELHDWLADNNLARIGRAQGFRGKFILAGIPINGGDDGLADAMKMVREKLLAYGNLLWGDGKPRLAEIAYEQALVLSGRNVAALNNRAVILARDDAMEDWFRIFEISSLFKKAVVSHGGFQEAKYNLASVLNYYRLYKIAKPHWDHLAGRESNIYDGTAIALQGLGQYQQAGAYFKKALDAGAASSRFAVVYHEVAEMVRSNRKNAEACISRLNDLDMEKLQGFEKTSVIHLKGMCEKWKEKN